MSSDSGSEQYDTGLLEDDEDEYPEPIEMDVEAGGAGPSSSSSGAAGSSMPRDDVAAESRAQGSEVVHPTPFTGVLPKASPLTTHLVAKDVDVNSEQKKLTLARVQNAMCFEDEEYQLPLDPSDRAYDGIGPYIVDRGVRCILTSVASAVVNAASACSFGEELARERGKKYAELQTSEVEIEVADTEIVYLNSMTALVKSMKSVLELTDPDSDFSVRQKAVQEALMALEGSKPVRAGESGEDSAATLAADEDDDSDIMKRLMCASKELLACLDTWHFSARDGGTERLMESMTEKVKSVITQHDQELKSATSLRDGALAKREALAQTLIDIEEGPYSNLVIKPSEFNDVLETDALFAFLLAIGTSAERVELPLVDDKDREAMLRRFTEAHPSDVRKDVNELVQSQLASHEVWQTALRSRVVEASVKLPLMKRGSERHGSASALLRLGGESSSNEASWRESDQYTALASARLWLRFANNAVVTVQRKGIAMHHGESKLLKVAVVSAATVLSPSTWDLSKLEALQKKHRPQDMHPMAAAAVLLASDPSASDVMTNMVEASADVTSVNVRTTKDPATYVFNPDRAVWEPASSDEVGVRFMRGIENVVGYVQRAASNWLKPWLCDELNTPEKRREERAVWAKGVYRCALLDGRDPLRCLSLSAGSCKSKKKDDDEEDGDDDDTPPMENLWIQIRKCLKQGATATDIMHAVDVAKESNDKGRLKELGFQVSEDDPVVNPDADDDSESDSPAMVRPFTAAMRDHFASRAAAAARARESDIVKMTAVTLIKIADQVARSAMTTSLRSRYMTSKSKEYLRVKENIVDRVKSRACLDIAEFDPPGKEAYSCGGLLQVSMEGAVELRRIVADDMVMRRHKFPMPTAEFLALKCPSDWNKPSPERDLVIARGPNPKLARQILTAYERTVPDRLDHLLSNCGRVFSENIGPSTMLLFEGNSSETSHGMAAGKTMVYAGVSGAHHSHGASKSVLEKDHSDNDANSHWFQVLNKAARILGIDEAGGMQIADQLVKKYILGDAKRECINMRVQHSPHIISVRLAVRLVVAIYNKSIIIPDSSMLRRISILTFPSFFCSMYDFGKMCDAIEFELGKAADSCKCGKCAAWFRQASDKMAERGHSCIAETLSGRAECAECDDGEFSTDELVTRAFDTIKEASSYIKEWARRAAPHVYPKNRHMETLFSSTEAHEIIHLWSLLTWIRDCKAGKFPPEPKESLAAKEKLQQVSKAFQKDNENTQSLVANAQMSATNTRIKELWDEFFPNKCEAAAPGDGSPSNPFCNCPLMHRAKLSDFKRLVIARDKSFGKRIGSQLEQWAAVLKEVGINVVARKDFNGSTHNNFVPCFYANNDGNGGYDGESSGKRKRV